MKNIASALVKSQKAFGPALKTSTNPHFKSKYADLAACVEAVITGLNDNGIALIQQCHESTDGVTVETIFMHESGEMYSAGKLHVPASKQDPQGYGSALTYARRYSLMAACGIAPEEDDANFASKTTTKPQPVQAQKITELVNQEQIANIWALIEEVKIDLEPFYQWISKNSGCDVQQVTHIPKSAYGAVIKALEGKRK